MCKKTILLLIALSFISFTAYADEEVDVQKFYDRELLTETLTADDQEALAAAQEAHAAAEAADLAAAEAVQADVDAQAALDADADAAAAAAVAADPIDPILDAAALELQATADETDANALQATADETDTVETGETLAIIEAEFTNTVLFVDGLSEEQVFALNRSLNNAVSSGLLVDIDSEDLALIVDANKLQINAFTQAFEQEARFLLKMDKFAAKAEESGDDKFLVIGDRMMTKADDQKAKFLSKMDRFSNSPSATAGAVAKEEARASAKAAAKDTSKGVAKAAAKKAAKETAKAAAKETAKGIAKTEAKRSAKAAAKLAAKNG